MANWDIRWFERFSPVYDYLMPPADSETLQAGIDRANRPVERVLDIGGGTGRGVRALSVPEKIVVDPARGMLEQAHDHDIAPIRASGSDLPVRADSIDAVLVVDALHHIHDQRAVLEESFRVLAPGGVLVIRDFDPTTVLGWFLVRGERLVGFQSTFQPPDRLRETLARIGFESAVVDRGFGYTVVGRVPA